MRRSAGVKLGMRPCILIVKQEPRKNLYP